MPRDFSSGRSWVGACTVAGLILAALPIAIHARAGRAATDDELHYSYGVGTRPARCANRGWRRCTR